MRLLGKLHRRLLPDEAEVGWTPYLWLAYWAIYLVFLPLMRPSPLVLAVSIGAALLFLPLYFAAYWHENRIAWYIAAITLIGVLALPINPMSSVFFVYATAFCGHLPYRQGARAIGIVVAVAFLEGLLLQLRPFAWLPACLIGAVVGFGNLYYSEISRKNRALRASQDEVRRLGAVAERERIARDLHDLLGHTLSVIALKSELAGRLLQKGDARAAAEIDDVTRISREALAEVRAAVTGFRAPDLAGEVANARLALSAADVDFSFEGDGGALPREHEAALALVLREAVTNVLRHAGARRCLVTLARAGGSVVLEVADDGRGAGALLEQGGLRGMRERLKALGGTLEVETKSGTRLLASLPLGSSGGSRSHPLAGAVTA